MAPAEAHAKADADHVALFPDGLDTEGQWVFALEDGDGVTVGSVWLGVRMGGAGVSGPSRAFVYSVEVDGARRGEGLGRRAMELVEEEARGLGLERIELNVFGGNEVARSLYRSLGYAELFVGMGKDLV
jgi:ribosomal protein S18 acetylase RimI-like enzyme